MKSLLTISSILLIAISVTARGGGEIPDYQAEQLTDHVWVIHGPTEFPNPQNRGFMNNPAFVITSGGVVVIEWADRFVEILPADHLWLTLDGDGSERRITLTATGPRHQRLVELLDQWTG